MGVVLNADSSLRYQPYPKLDPAFVLARLGPTWSDLSWGLRNGWIQNGDALRMAEGLAHGDPDLGVALALSDAPGQVSLGDVLEGKARGEAISEDVVRSRWLWVAVAWAYEHRSLYEDPLMLIEEIWEAFGHADAVDGLVRWMPAQPGQDVGIEAIMDRWRRFAEGPPPG